MTNIRDAQHVRAFIHQVDAEYLAKLITADERDKRISFLLDDICAIDLQRRAPVTIVIVAVALVFLGLVCMFFGASNPAFFIRQPPTVSP